MKKAKRLQKPPTSKRRKNRQRAKRLEHAEAMNVIKRQQRKMRSDVSIVALRREREGEIVIGVREGHFGHPRSVILRVDDPAIVGCVEDRSELAKLVNNVGILVTSQLFGHNLAEGIDDLARSIARWAGIDLEALAKEAEADGALGPYQCQHCPDTFEDAEGYSIHLGLVHQPPDTTTEVPVL